LTRSNYGSNYGQVSHFNFEYGLRYLANILKIFGLEARRNKTRLFYMTIAPCSICYSFFIEKELSTLINGGGGGGGVGDFKCSMNAL